MTQHTPDHDERSPLHGAGLLECPDECVDAIFERIESDESRDRVLYKFPSWAAPLASAAVLLIAVGGTWLAIQRTQSEPSQAELEAMAANLRYVLFSTGDAVRRGNEAAVEDVFSRRVAPAVKQAPIGFSQQDPTSGGTNGL